MATKYLKDYSMLNSYHRGCGVLDQALFLAMAREELYCVHDFTCGKDDVSLFQQLQKLGNIGLRWPKILSKCKKLIQQCDEPLEVEGLLFVEEVGDWRKLYSNFTLQMILSLNHSSAMKIKQSLGDLLLRRANYLEEISIRHL